MSGFLVRPAVDGERRPLLDVLGRSLHAPPLTDEDWEKRREGFPADRKLGAFVDGTPVGVASSMGTELVVPGGKAVPAAALDGIGVRADHTRRGVLTALMREQLSSFVERGEILAALHASETAIYGRFGYGIASLVQYLRVSRTRAEFRDDAPSGGQVRLIEMDEAFEVIPRLYANLGDLRPGRIARAQCWWRSARADLDDHLAAVHTGPGGDDGFVLYRSADRFIEQSSVGAALHVRDLHAGNVAALAGLWRFLLRTDLVSEVRVPGRPLDEPLGAMLTDPRACQVAAVEDEMWLRVLDVPAALAARSYRDGRPVVIEVDDARLPTNTGRYLIGPGGASRTDEPARLRLDVGSLAMMYLGEWSATTLAAVGRITALDAEAARDADELLRTPERPWCGTLF